MFRRRTFRGPGGALAALALGASCSTSPSQSTGPDPQPAPGAAQPQSETDLTATRLGVAIAARDDRGAPRLVRAIAPRPARVAGMTASAAARDHLAALAPLWMHDQRPAELAPHGEQRFRNGAQLVRLQQQIDHVDIHEGELRVMVHGDGALAAVSGTLRPSVGRVVFRSNPVAAVEHALDAVYGASRARPAITEADERAGYRTLTVAPAPDLLVHSARAKRELLPDGDRLTPIWTVELVAETRGATRASAARRLLIGDFDGAVLRDVDLTKRDAFVYRAFADPTGNRNPLDGPLQSFAPHPTGTPDGTLPSPVESNLVVMDSFNGPRDPWLSANATTTSGNNVDAFADLRAPMGFSEGDIRPVVRAGRTLNYRYDFTAEPIASPTQSMAAAVNVFFVTNWLHDWYYDSGFTEATGNAQVDNYGRGGVAGDPLIAHAQADGLGMTRDNANISVPADGLSPDMNMFLWTGLPTSRLTGPTGEPPTAVFQFAPTRFDLEATAVVATNLDDGAHTACTPVSDDVNGKIAFIDFDGTCEEGIAVDNLAAAGAIGVIAALTIPGFPLQDLLGSGNNPLPGIVLGADDGRALQAALPAQVTIHRAKTIEHDGDFDNAIIGHEWGHYLHLRLASCELTSQCAAMSEGWGDFVALHMMLRETDDRDGTYAPGLYALTAGGMAEFGFADPGYFGIRRYPYSRDRDKNPLSFRHIGLENDLPAGVPVNEGPAGNGNPEVHNAGEVWAQMLWEVYNLLIDEHGFTSARRRMSDYVVAGLLLTPPEATYTEARDALLAAASALDTDDLILMAAAFAGRGAGTCAVAPERGSFDFTGVVESGTIAARLQTSAIRVTDDVASCDHDGILDPGESGTLRIALANTGIIAAEDVTLSATTTTPGVTLGRPVDFGSIASQTQLDLEIPLRLATTVPAATPLELAITVDGDAGCNTRHLVVALHPRSGVDQHDAVSTDDDLETSVLAWTPTGDDSEALWTRSQDAGSGNHVLFGENASFRSDVQLLSPVLQASPTEPLVVTLRHAYDFEAFELLSLYWDGGVIEVTSDGGATWLDITQVGVDAGYPGTLTRINPLPGRPAFAGRSPGFPERRPLVLDFGTQFAGQAVQLRFRIGNDDFGKAFGWVIDDIVVRGITNTPFPGFTPEPEVCRGGTAARVDTGVAAVHRARSTSFDGVALP